MLCKDCPHFRIICEPIKGFDMGTAHCEKHDLYVEFLNHGKFKWLSCVDDERREDDEQ